MNNFWLHVYLKVRWAWFHISPNYMKFSMEGTEFHFQHRKTGMIHSNYYIKEEEND